LATAGCKRYPGGKGCGLSASAGVANANPAKASDKMRRCRRSMNASLIDWAVRPPYFVAGCEQWVRRRGHDRTNMGEATVRPNPPPPGEQSVMSVLAGNESRVILP
jgi:hypothetical protein